MDKQKSGMTSIIVAYDYCNLGGVTSVFKQRLRMMPVLMPTFHFMFAKDLGGRAELLGLDGVRVDLCPNGEFRNWVTNHLLCAKPQTIEAVILIDQPEILHAMVEGGFFSKPDRPRVVYEIHTSLERTFTRMLDVDFRMVNSIVVPSRWLKRKVQELLPTLPVDLITIIPNFIDRTLFEMLDETDATLSDAAAPLVVWIGKLVADKNFVDACKIMKQLSTRRKIKPVFVSGGAAEQPQVVDFLSTLALHGLIDDAIWIANLPNYDVPKLLNRARRTGGLFLSTSKFESFGLSILEALESFRLRWNHSPSS